MGKQTLQYKSSIKPYKAVKTFLLTLLRSLKLFSITEVNKRTTTRIFTVHSDTQHNKFLILWCSGYHYCTTSFNKAWTQVLPGNRFKSCWRRVRDSRWWGYLAVVPATNKAKRLSSVNHTTKQFIIIVIIIIITNVFVFL